jgi:HAD superfamily hydrolase (TIGR01459 family)
MPAKTISILSGIGAMQPPARAWICDIWGVIHNGVAAFPAAVEACVTFRAGGGHVIFVSNAPRPSDGVVLQLNALGVPKSAYDAVLTSGDVTRERLADWQHSPTLHIGPQRDLTLFAGLDIPLVDRAQAQRVLCSGLYDDTIETPQHYRELLSELAQRKVPMLCANPDIKVDRGGKIIYCAGAVAGLYAELGGVVDYAGKPHAPIYVTAREMLKQLAGRELTNLEIVAIGDGIHTDIPGGIAAGFRTVYVSSAIHLDAPMTPEALRALFPNPADQPDVAMEQLAW